MAAGLGPRLLALALALALGPAGMCAELMLVESGGRLRVPGESVHLSCRGSDFNFEIYSVLWYRQALGGSLQWLSYISPDSSYIRYGPAVKGRATASRDNSKSKTGLTLNNLHLQDSARYFCAVHTGTGLCATAPLIFGKGTQLTVEPSNQKDSDPEVILIKSKPLEEGGSTGKAACLARNFYPKNINLNMLPAEVIYEQNTPIVTPEGTYDTIKVVNVTKASEVSCTANFKGNFFPANATSSEKVVEEPITANVCNTTDTSSKGDIKTEKTNMLSMAVLGLRVLLAKSIAFNTLMSIKLFLF
ncbi:Ig heavy chain Mem5-like [Cygnus olor]|uniref:Ig heavy chain Mem5-like n=1 Tax=Cygnus olor TaxID=8869 RepID=UPI001ADE231F|nr:Ig heavy chain Mem5-like [Cygnus olor]